MRPLYLDKIDNGGIDAGRAISIKIYKANGAEV